MTNKCIKNILQGKDIVHLYHVNTVKTACTFLENRGLLSRGAVEDRGLKQTPQETDATDKEVDVYYDIFFDSVDIHQRSRSINHYGPVTFVYSIDLLDALPEDSIRITKDNPIRWHPGMSEADKYFQSEYELRAVYTKGAFNQHLTIRHQYQPLSFEHLERIIIDDPGIANNSYFDNAFAYIKNLIAHYARGVPLEVRQCPADCRCKSQYNTYKEGFTYFRFNYR